MMTDEMLRKIKTQDGFIAALDQSGGSTPKALGDYGVAASEYTGEQEMFAKVHEMRTRIITDPAFSGDRVIGAILFENTMDREIEGRGTARYLWEVKRVVPFLKVDKGLAEAANDAQLMKPMPTLDSLLTRAKSHGVFGTKMRSVIKDANEAGVKAVVDQQFEVAKQILGAGLVPIIEPEVDIHSPHKKQAEELLKKHLLAHLGKLGAEGAGDAQADPPRGRTTSTPSCVAHKNVLRVVALSGGYSRADANARLARNHGVIASFSRALSEGLSAKQSAAEFHRALDTSIQGIFEASRT